MIPADWFCFLQFVSLHAVFLLPLPGSLYLPGGQFRFYPVINGLEILPFQEAAGLLNDSANVVKAAQTALIPVPGVNLMPLRTVQQGQSLLRPPVNPVYYHFRHLLKYSYPNIYHYIPMGYNVKYFFKYSDNFSMPNDQISFRLPKELLEAIDFMATRDLRTRTNMIEFILTSWIREHEPLLLEEDEKFLEAVKNMKKTK
jgi:predicted DNA-binding protein